MGLTGSRKRTTAVWLAALLLLAMTALAGCGNGSNSESNQEPAETSGTEGTAATAAPSTGDDGKVNPTGFPIVNEPIKLTFFASKSTSNLGDWNNATIWKEYKKMTNIDVDFQLVPVDALEEKRNLTLASNDLPDAFHTARLSSVDVANYGSQGVFIPLNDLIDKYAPNLKKVMETYPEVKKAITMPDGNIYSFPTLLDPGYTSGIISSQMWINQSFLDALGMKMPQTTEDLYNYLVAVKTKDPNHNGKADEVPFATSTGKEGFSWTYDHLKGAWGLGNRGNTHPRVDIDPATNELRFIPTDPKNKEVLEYMKRLNDEGLLFKDIFNVTSNDVSAVFPEGVVGSSIGLNPNLTYPGVTGYVGVGALKGPHGDQIFSRARSFVILTGGMTITKANKYPEATVRWVDYFYGDEGNKLFQLGVEGTSYTEKNGKYEWVPALQQDPNLIGKNVTWAGGWYPGMDNQKYILSSTTAEENLRISDEIRPFFPQEIWPEFTYSDAEITEFRALETDIVKYVNEMANKFVTGVVPFTEWDHYVATLKKMGLDRYMDIYNQAYERYKNS